ncbi:redoxin domain-containing protein [Caballeronia temeraria]|uniref:Redoxin domain-containing protein n=1 Tax=Caballeronia temeraria TaxID=1777137 RepID=A0A158CZG4_9BURK|nr:TlpA disulfide reductase family protein [Caballeronia temeraria]SAK87346.1 redoxin domain-containing protein [Caballeronia temeraria]
MKSTRILAALVVAVAATVGGFYAGHLFTGGETVAATQTSGNAVDQLWKATPPGASGTSQPLSAYKGKPVVVNFWASWCGPCVKEMPALSALQRDYAKKGVTFIGLGVDSEKNVNDFLKKVPVAYPVYVTGFGGADLARSFGNNAGGLPFTVVIDAKGQIRSTKLGEVDPAELKHTLDSL